MDSKTCDHTSVGMLVWRDGRLLLIERRRPPFGFAPPAGHCDGDSFERSARRELKEEVGLDVQELKLLIEGRKENACRRQGGSWHYWKVYQVKAEGEVKRSLDETKQAGWYSLDEIKRLAEKTEKYLAGEVPEEKWQRSPGLEPVWREWFKDRLQII